MKKKLFLLIALLLINLFQNASYGESSISTNSNTSVSKSDVDITKYKNKLSKIIKEPFDIEVDDSRIMINVHDLINSSDDFLKDKIFTYASFLAAKKLFKEVYVAKWNKLDSNYSYKAALLLDDLNDYKHHKITLDELFSKIKIVLNQMNLTDETVKDTLNNVESDKSDITSSEDVQKLTISPSDELVVSTEKLDLKPKISSEKLYTPVLKPYLRDEFSVIAEDNAVIVNINSKYPEDDLGIKNYAYNIFKQVIGINPSLDKIAISWQPTPGGFGKDASIAGIYIKDYFTKKMTADEIKDVILISSIEPCSRHLTNVPEIPKIEVPIENLRKAKELREAANIYRLNNKLDSALRTYKQAIKFNSNDYLSYYWIGEIYLTKSDKEEAKKAFETSLGLNSEFRQSDEALAKMNNDSSNIPNK